MYFVVDVFPRMGLFQQCPLCGCGEAGAEHLMVFCPAVALAWESYPGGLVVNGLKSEKVAEENSGKNIILHCFSNNGFTMYKHTSKQLKDQPHG